MSFTNLCCGACTFAVFIISIPTVFIPMGILLNIESNTCFIDHIEIPIADPSINSQGWIECSCGRSCDSFKPCIKIYSNLSDDTYLTQNIYNFNQECTFLEDIRCNDTTNYNNLINESLNTYNQYINTSLNCYHTSNYDYGIFLSNEFNLTIIILIGLILLIGVCILYVNNKKIIKSYFKSKCQFKSNQNNINIENVKEFDNPVFEVVIDNLPIVKLNNEEKKDTCPICLEELGKKKYKVVKLNCNHKIHQDCWNQWKIHSKTCPVCRENQ
jgi:hypothetical protein